MLARSCGTSVRPDVGAVNRCAVPIDVSKGIGLPLKVLKNAEPGAIAFPTGETVMARSPGSVLSWNIPPGRAQLESPQDPIDHAPMVGIPMTSRRVTRKQRLQSLPLAVTQICSRTR